MLHEILLSLSGIQSPVWDQVRNSEGPEGQNINSYVSPPERAMLQTLAHLQDLHVSIRETTARIVVSHQSMVCRALAASISNVHLGRFMNKIIEVESSILKKDATYVGGHGIVPLSTLVGEFSPWSRRLEWLASIAKHLEQGDRPDQKPSGATALNLLRHEIHTGYADISEMATALLALGERTWMRAAAVWILYGKLPPLGAHDFCINRNPNFTTPMDMFMIEKTLLPEVVNTRAAHALLSIGSALNQLQTQALSTSSPSGRNLDLSTSLLSDHLKLLESLSYPLNPSLLESVLTAINQSISENALSQILPVTLVMRLLQVILRYVLLDRGEFAISMITHANERVMNRQQTQTSVRPIRKVGRLDDLAIKEVELSGIVSRSFAELAVSRGDEEVDDDVFDLAKSSLSLKSCDSRANILSTLLPTPTLLRLTIPSSSPLHIFLSPQDINDYSILNAYLLAIHRAGLQLSSLWKLSTQRRCHPTPLGPPASASEFGKATLASRRAREDWRNRRTRRHWITASKTMFMTNELKVYLQGEVIQSSWQYFRTWITSSGTETLASAKSSRPGTASSAAEAKTPNLRTSTGTGPNKFGTPSDPRALADAHRAYLEALKAALFLANTEFVEILKELLSQIDHFVALFSRLQTVWEGLDLQEDEGVMDAFSNFAQDEKEVLAEMDRTSGAMEGALVEVVDKLRDVERDNKVGPGVTGVIETLSGVELNGKKFVPWRARTVDRLIMKLDGLTGKQEDDRDSLGIASAYENE
ncbi:uncharacterized protein A1O9_08467 [Exophiala aquamarina CBS 119918]|uniref:Spindle pole body component n=1 Tax=Exophiala aquamarina CBS 119918 TaxID=1182545 RepID=A0A072P7L4_9EURO|nr:uncharacterized protein A1O9_08467 [Exophiala aquamarina CBS 119918]KEF55717.1 hypothetical protein A1O9_08467 [Exophiala aquamarina CBS 119918]